MIRYVLPVDFVRFLVVTIVGLALDIAVAWTFAVKGGMALPLAAVCGFAAGAAFNYVAHEFWTFGGDKSRLSLRRGFLYLTSVGAVFVVRIVAVDFLENTFSSGPWMELQVLLSAAGISFAVNYVLSKCLVFRR